MNVPVFLKISAPGNGDSYLETTLTTGTEQSPDGKLKNTGVPLDVGGEITLVADGSFSGGNILNGADASLVITGTFSPAPLQGAANEQARQQGAALKRAALPPWACPGAKPKKRAPSEPPQKRAF